MQYFILKCYVRQVGKSRFCVVVFFKKSFEIRFVFFFVDFFSIWVNYLLFPFSVEQDPGLDIGVK